MVDSSAVYIHFFALKRNFEKAYAEIADENKPKSVGGRTYIKVFKKPLTNVGSVALGCALYTNTSL